MLTHYVHAMVCSTDQISHAWSDSARYDMLVEMRRIALLILTGTLFRLDFTPQMQRLWPAVLRTLAYISPGLWLIWRGAPRPGYAGARRQLDDYLYQIIRTRREAPDDSQDLLGLLVTAPGMSDDLIRDQLLTMLIAGHDTSTALLAWALYRLGRHPAVMERARAEVDVVLGDDEPTVVHTDQLRCLDWVIKETLRLYPPIHLGSRMAANDLEFQGYRIPAGTRVLYSIYLTHRQAAHWPDPTRFDPERFTPEQSRTRPPYSYLPFGGGPRNCMGAAFAQIEAKMVLARLLQNYDFQLGRSEVHPHMGATLEPRPGVMMTVRQRRKR
jgi:cytochrome P450